MAKVSQKQKEQRLVEIMAEWQEVEDDAIRMTKEVQAKTDNPLVKLIMEIIAHDSAMHRRTQQFIIDSMTKEAITLQPEELEAVWDLIEQHIEVEKKTISLADEAKDASKRLFVQKYLLNYLLQDEQKHDALLERLEEIKLRMYPYAG